MRVSDSPVRDIAFCPRCEHDTSQRVVHVQHDHTDRGSATVWYVLVAACEGCDGALVYYTYANAWETEDDVWGEFHTDLRFSSLLWPHRSDIGTGVPGPIKRLYHDGARVRKTNPAHFAIQIRKSLEAICSDKKVFGGPLRDRLRRLGERGLLQPVHVQMVEEIVPIVNAAAHHDSEFNASLMPYVDNAFRTIAEHLYTTPRLLGVLRAKIRGIDTFDEGSEDEEDDLW
ncbi:MAG TPA: DUF4145 domain-containing protein [Longimicrobium sp.]|nr:DUF4145 domain-containing protein [Longimicrobium sp.]